MTWRGVVLFLGVAALLVSCQGLSGTFERENAAEIFPTVTEIPTFPDGDAGLSPTVSPTSIIPLADLLSTATSAPFSSETIFQPAFSSSCSDGLTYMGDLTFPDRTKVLPGQPVEKRWKVRNSGTCDWGPDYRFRWNNGSLPAPQVEQALYPAVAGSEAVIILTITAPSTSGEYISWWQAVAPSGAAFGDMLSIDLIVAP